MNTHLHKSHVDLVHIWSLFSVEFDADKVVTEDFTDLLILKGLPLHNMAPVACRITNWWEETDSVNFSF